MRYLFGFMCVLALSIMGCGETTGTGGSGGDAGSGGTGGECLETEFDNICPGVCFEGVCIPAECEGLEEGTECFWGNIVVGGGGRGFCEGGTCTPAVEDCADEEVFTACTIDDEEGHCWLEQCAAFDCSDLEDGTYCEFAVLGDGTKGVCEAGECTKPQDCTGLEDGWDCNVGGEDGGFCDHGECVVPMEDCSGEDNYTLCGSDGSLVHFCSQGLCVTAGCSGQEDGSYCSIGVLGDGRLGVCEAGQCTIPEDCTGLPDGLSCISEDGVICEGGECVAIP